MADTVRDLMTPDPVTVDASAPVAEAARVMRDRHVGDVMVLQGGRLRGIVTDRDIVVRVVAEERDARTSRAGDVVSTHLVTVTPDDPVERAVALMRENALRRLPVVDGDRPVGIVSLGDLAVEREPRSALGQISAAPANN
jgi:CBS domain-containing protein